ncbi:hypothetical protein [Irregularibacter muris]
MDLEEVEAKAEIVAEVVPLVAEVPVEVGRLK